MQVQETKLQTGIEFSFFDSSPLVVDQPIANRKEIRRCTQYPMSYFAFKKLSPKYWTFLAQLNSIEIPQTLHQALDNENWKKAMWEA